MDERVTRVELTEAAEDLVRTLTDRHGPLMFHQSGGCCDGSAPMCYPRGKFRVGAVDVLLGRVAGDVLVRSRVLTEEEWARVEAEPPLPTGAEEG